MLDIPIEEIYTSCPISQRVPQFMDWTEYSICTGKGRFHVRSKCDVHDDSKGKRIIVQIPIRSQSDMLVHIADLVSKGTVVDIRDIRDESSKEGIR